MKSDVRFVGAASDRTAAGPHDAADIAGAGRGDIHRQAAGAIADGSFRVHTRDSAHIDSCGRILRGGGAGHGQVSYGGVRAAEKPDDAKV